MSKVFISGLRIGWIIAAPELIRRAVLVKQSADMSSATLEQELAARVLETGLLRTHLDLVLPRYRERRDLMIDALQRHCGEALIPNRPGGGMSLWCRLTGGFSARALLGEAVREGVVFLPGDSFSVDSDESSKLRICFGLGTEADLEEGAERLGRAIAAISQRAIVRWPPPPSSEDSRPSLLSRNRWLAGWAGRNTCRVNRALVLSERIGGRDAQYGTARTTDSGDSGDQAGGYA